MNVALNRAKETIITPRTFLKPADWISPKIGFLDRPGWIPPHILFDWDTDPYAYQTEEESMPEGGPHGQLSGYLYELLRSHLKERGLMLLLDVFMFYRDRWGIKQRIAPDLLLMPDRFPAPSSYDTTVLQPPSFVVEITSPKTHNKDLDDNVSLYMDWLSISTYLVIDAMVPGKDELREQIQLHVWRKTGNQVVKMVADSEGGFVLPEMGLRIKAEGQLIIFVDSRTGDVLLDMTGLKKALMEEVKQAKQEARRADAAEKRAAAAEKRAAAAAERAAVAEKQVEAEAEARRMAEAEIARLKALLAEKQ
jgi:Uma2 family endonuclease